MAIVHRFSFGNIGIVEVDADPNGNVTENSGSLAIDSVNNKFYINADNSTTWTIITSGAGAVITDHGALSGLLDDDHTQYALLAGRANGQSLSGSNDGSGALRLYGGGGADISLLESRLCHKQHADFAGSNWYQKTGGVQTVGATAGTILTGSVPADSVFWIEAHVTARDTLSDEYAVYVRQALVRRSGSADAVLGDGTGVKKNNNAVYTIESNKDWDVLIDVSGSVFRVRTSGSAGLTVNWTGTANYQGVLTN